MAKQKAIPAGVRRARAELHNELVDLLEWFSTNPTHCATLLCNGRMVEHGNPITHMQITGRMSRKRIRKSVWDLVSQFLEPGKQFDSRMFVPNSRGRKLLREYQERRLAISKQGEITHEIY